MSAENGNATTAEPLKLVPKQGRIATLEAEVAALRTQLDEVRWCFMELLHHMAVAQKVVQMQQHAQAHQLLAADPDVQRMMQAQQGVAPTI